MHVCLQTLKCVQKHADMRGHAVYIKQKQSFTILMSLRVYVFSTQSELSQAAFLQFL